MSSRELSKTAKSCTACISMRAASMRESLKMRNSMERDSSKTRTEVCIKDHSKMAGSMDMGSSNGQTVLNTEEAMIWESVRVRESSSTAKIQAFRVVFGVEGC